MRISDPRQFGRVAVVMGGNSAEREVSLDSGRNVLDALKSRGVDAHAIDGIPALLDALRAGHFARVFNILHGRGRRGRRAARRAGIARRARTPARACSAPRCSMDKIRTKQVWKALGLPTPRYRALCRAATMSVRRCETRPAGRRQAVARRFQRRHHARVRCSAIWRRRSNSPRVTTANSWSSK